MSGFSIDLAAERIHDPRTRVYFEEVTRSFATDCFRSSLVMLWTVVICDLFYKLQTLADLYGDTTAKKLLGDVEKLRVAKPNNPEWELFLLDEVATRTKLLEPSDHLQLQHLQKLRHLSAHPVLTATDLLFRPTKETARAHIRLALEALLLKPPIFSKPIIATLIADLAANRGSLLTQDKLKAYLEARYLPNIPLAIELDIFKTLWKFCFRLDNADTDANREINLTAIAILYNRNRGAVRKMIDDERTQFSNVGPANGPLDALVGFISDHEELYTALDSAAQMLVDNRIASDINNRVKARFKAADLATHLANLLAETPSNLGKMTDGSWLDLQTRAEAESLMDDAHKLAVKAYVESGTYDAADTRFARFIEPALPKFSSATLTNLLAGIDVNQQTYGRGRASLDHPKIENAASVVGVSTLPYKWFRQSL